MHKHALSGLPCVHAWHGILPPPSSDSATPPALLCRHGGHAGRVTLCTRSARQNSNLTPLCCSCRRGAQALRVALCINSAMTELNLEGNMLDAKATAEIVKGLGQVRGTNCQ